MSFNERLRIYLGLHCTTSFTAADLAAVDEIGETDAERISKTLSHLFKTGWATRESTPVGFTYRGEIAQRKRTVDEIVADIPSVFPHEPRAAGDGYGPPAVPPPQVYTGQPVSTVPEFSINQAGAVAITCNGVGVSLCRADVAALSGFLAATEGLWA